MVGAAELGSGVDSVVSTCWTAADAEVDSKLVVEAAMGMLAIVGSDGVRSLPLFGGPFQFLASQLSSMVWHLSPQILHHGSPLVGRVSE